MIYDFLIIGAGSAGCNCAYALNKAGKKVAIVDKEGICAGGSGAAGAFLSPLPGKKNHYNSLVNSALYYSINFYENLLPNSVTKKGVLRVQNDNFDKTKLKNNELNYEYKTFENIEGYFYKNAAIINPLEMCNKLVQNCDFFLLDVPELIYKDNIYHIKNLKAKQIILTQGVNTPIVDYSYIKIHPVFGVKIDVKTSTNIPFNIHKSISVSTNKKDGTVAIGATSIKHYNLEGIKCNTSCDKCMFLVNNDDEDIKSLLTQANELVNLKNVELIKVYKGARATLKSYFPVVGKIIDYKKSIKKYPAIKKGKKIQTALLEYYPNTYILNGLGSRGFVFGPYLAKILKEHILDGADIPKNISTEKLFYKMARKQN